MSFKLFFRLLVIVLFLSFTFILVIVNLINKQADIVHEIEVKKSKSLLLAYELKQSSDDLTRLVRTYTVTGDAKYEKMYFDIIHIRTGKKERKDGAKISLLQKMVDVGFTQNELAYLKKAGDNSNDLIALETKAMNAVKGLFIDSNGKYTIKKEADLNFASRLVFSNKYHEEKSTIAKPINDFSNALEKRIQKEVNKSVELNNFYINLLIFIIVVSILSFFALFFINKDKIKNLTLFKDSLLNFFKYLNNEIEYSGTININTKDEIGEMTKVVNENILNTKNKIEEDKLLIEDVIKILADYEKGDLSKKVKSTTSNKSLQQLTDLLNNMASNLESSINKILDVLNEFSNMNYIEKVNTSQYKGHLLILANSINDLGSSTSKMLLENKMNGLTLNESSEVLLQNVSSLNKNSNESAASLEETAAALEEVTGNITHNTDTIIKMASYASELQISANEGKEFANQTTIAMNDIDKQVNAINDAISVIDQISFQTNILSLNAAVEAATAGEAGKGFAVVAQEVRNLASRSAEAANEIKVLVESATSKADDGKNISDKMIKGYVSLDENIIKTIDLISDVESASKEQKIGIEQINDAITSLDRQTQENANVASITNEIASKTDSIAKLIIKSADEKTFEGQDTQYLE